MQKNIKRQLTLNQRAYNVYRKTFLNILYLFFTVYYAIFPYQKPKSIETILTISEQYCKKQKSKFLETFDEDITNTFNSNIECTFYNKAELHKMFEETDNELENSWKTRVLLENTPRGNIIMFYAPYKSGFAYYSDATNIPYSILNAVAMKYVTIYNCRNFFVDNKVTPENAESPFIKLYLEEDIKKNAEKPSITSSNKQQFAKLKTYSAQVEIKKPIDQEIKLYYQNKFICLGKIGNYSFLQTVKKQSPVNGFSSNLLENISSDRNVLDYKAFKARQSTNSISMG